MESTSRSSKAVARSRFFKIIFLKQQIANVATTQPDRFLRSLKKILLLSRFGGSFYQKIENAKIYL